MKDIVIIGAGGFGREVAWLIEDINKIEKQFNIVGFLDEDLSKKDSLINGYKVLGDFNSIKNSKNLFFTCAVGNTEVKKELVEKAISFGMKQSKLIHPSVIKGGFNSIAEGVIICAGTILTVNVNIKKNVTINLMCTIGHDAIIDEYCTLYPSVNISGNCNVGKLSEIGTRTAIIQGIQIGEKTITGAGSIVIRNTEVNSTVVGAPAKKIK